MKEAMSKEVVCIIGLGYVGLPLAEAFARIFPVIGFDIDANKLFQKYQPLEQLFLFY